MDAGTNRINRYTVRKATAGLATYLKNTVEGEINVAVAYDSRNNSEEYAKETALTLCSYGIRAHLFSYVSATPLLSFAVRHLKCAAGVVITASHNPKEYNGYKVYGADGCQAVPHIADGIIAKIKEIEDITRISPILKYYNNKRDIPSTYFPMPKSIFNLGLTSGEILVYTYLMYCEDRQTHQCYPSYSTIGEAVDMSNNTVKKHVKGLEKKGLITTEYTTVKTKDGRTHNGSLLYTLRSLQPMEEAYFQKKIRDTEARLKLKIALEKQQKYGS